MTRYLRVPGLLASVALIGFGGPSHADGGFANQINYLFGPNGITLNQQASGNFPSHTAHFSSDSLATLGSLVGQLAPSAADVPAVSTVPGMTFAYDSELQAFVPTSGSLGPVFVERPQTIGQGKFSVGVAYLRNDFTTLDGEDLDGMSFTGLTHAPVHEPGEEPQAFENDTASITFNKFQLQSNVVTLYSTYGITDKWDVNIVLPIVDSSLEVDAVAKLDNRTLTPRGTPFHTFPNGTNTQKRSIRDSHAGVGDILLRTKYHLFSSGDFNFASGLTLRLPTGDPDYFQGLGDVTVYPYFSLAQQLGRFDFHLTGGVEANAADTERSRVRYAGGVTVQVFDQFAFLADVIGNANVTDQTVAVRVPVFSNVKGHEQDVVGSRTDSRSFSTNIVDLNLGFKAAFGKSLVGYAGVLIPVNDDGLRSDVVPTALLQGAF